MKDPVLYKVIYIQQGALYEIYVRQLLESDMMGFIEVSDFVFGENQQIVVDPSEEKLKSEFKDVRCSYIPMHAVIRIDRVNQKGKAKITQIQDLKSKVTSLHPSHFIPDTPSDT